MSCAQLAPCIAKCESHMKLYLMVGCYELHVHRAAVRVLDMHKCGWKGFACVRVVSGRFRVFSGTGLGLNVGPANAPAWSKHSGCTLIHPHSWPVSAAQL
jgi:hypothetical protein